MDSVVVLVLSLSARARARVCRGGVMFNIVFIVCVFSLVLDAINQNLLIVWKPRGDILTCDL